METSRRHARGGRAAAGESDDERINPATPGRLTGLMFSPFTVAPLGNCTRRRGGVFLGMNAEDFISLVGLSFAGGARAGHARDARGSARVSILAATWGRLPSRGGRLRHSASAKKRRRAQKSAIKRKEAT